MTALIPRSTNPERAARILEQAMRWYETSNEGARVKRPIKVRLVTNPAAMVAYVKAALQAQIATRQRYGDDTRR